jgi:hypothetical protein
LAVFLAQFEVEPVLAQLRDFNRGAVGRDVHGLYLRPRLRKRWACGQSWFVISAKRELCLFELLRSLKVLVISFIRKQL